MSSSTLCPSPPSAALGDSFSPDSFRDVPRIYRAAERLRREIAELDGAVGATTHWQRFRGRGGSVSAWASV